MAESGLKWLDAIPEIGFAFISEGQYLADQRVQLESQLDDIRRKEVALWVRIAESGKWTAKEINMGLVAMTPDLLKFLPEKTPGPPRKPRSRGPKKKQALFESSAPWQAKK
jgi:hypothetical protein